jgi:hypothetical protein
VTPQPASPVPASPGPASLQPASPGPAAGKPTIAGLGIDLAAQAWHRSGHGDGAIEIAFAKAAVAVSAGEPAPEGGSEWILMRVAGDPDQRVLVFDRHEWECFLDGARNGEFDAAAAPGPLGPPQNYCSSSRRKLLPVVPP